MSDLLVIVPSRGRPESLARVVEAWAATGAFVPDAALTFVIDPDDPDAARYKAAFLAVDLPDPAGRGPVTLVTVDRWRPLVPKLNLAATTWADRHFALAFMGDDHLPRTHGWAGTYLDALHELGTGIVYGDDGIQGDRLPTQWAMTADIVRALGRMVPAAVEHLYCDNAIRDLGQAANCLRYLPDVLIEHMHPVAGKAEMDDGYRRVNRAGQYQADRLRYEAWRTGQLPADAATVRGLRAAMGVER